MRWLSPILIVAALAGTAVAQPLEGTVSSLPNDNGKHLHLTWSRAPEERNMLLILRRPADGEKTPLPTGWSGDKLPNPGTKLGGWTVAYMGDGVDLEFTDEVELGTPYVYAFLEGVRLADLNPENAALVDLRYCMAVHALRAREAAAASDLGNLARHLAPEHGLPCEAESKVVAESTAVPPALREQVAAWRIDVDELGKSTRGGDLKGAAGTLEERRLSIDLMGYEKLLDHRAGADPLLGVIRAADLALWGVVADDATPDTAKGALAYLRKAIEKAPQSVQDQTADLLAVTKKEGPLDPTEVAWELIWARPAKIQALWVLQHLADSQPVAPVAAVYNTDRTFYLVLVGLTVAAFLLYLGYARKHAKSIFIRRMPGVDAIEDAIGRSTEMGRPVLYVTGIEEIQDIQTLASVLILGHVATLTADYDTEIKVCNTYPMTMVVAEEVVRQGYANAGRLDAHKPENVMFITSEQFAFAAAVNGMILRDKPATNIYFGRFFAESLMLAETGYLTGSVQIAGTAEFSQLPFFIAACDYTLLGEELYAVGAYLSREPTLLAQLKAGDVVKLTAMLLIVVGMILATLGVFQLGPWLMP